MDISELTTIVQDLRAEGSDLAEIEVKRAEHGLPESCRETLSAFANTPGGGLLILGLNEASGFRVTGVSDTAAVQSALASVARQAMDPPITFSSGTIPIDNADLVWAGLHFKPRHTSI